MNNDNHPYLGKTREIILMIATLVFAVAFAFDIIYVPEGLANGITQIVITSTWVIFAIDYMICLILAEKKLSWVVRHIPELLVVALPALRSFRLLRLLGIALVFQRVGGNQLRKKLITYIIGTTFILIFTASLAILDVERNASGTYINNFGDAVWWAVTTITTVGYGDISPVTVTGRIIAFLLMLSGIGLLGTVTATLASWIVEQVNQGGEKEERKTEANQTELIESLRNEIAEVKALLVARNDADDNPTPSSSHS